MEATKRLIKDASRQVEESCSIEQKAEEWNPKAARPAKVCVLTTDWRSTESLVQYEQLWKWMSRVGDFSKAEKLKSCYCSLVTGDSARVLNIRSSATMAVI